MRINRRTDALTDPVPRQLRRGAAGGGRDEEPAMNKWKQNTIQSVNDHNGVT